MDRLRESSTCAFFECERARLGSAGASKVRGLLDSRVPAVVAERFGIVSKKPVAPSNGVIGVTGDESMSGKVAGVLRKLRSMVEKSESWFELMEELDEPDDDVEIDRMSGAVRAWTLVVEISSVGREIKLRLMVPAGYLTDPPLVGIDVSWLRLPRFVNARARAMVEDAIVDDGRDCFK